MNVICIQQKKIRAFLFLLNGCFYCLCCWCCWCSVLFLYPMRFSATVFFLVIFFFLHLEQCSYLSLVVCFPICVHAQSTTNCGTYTDIYCFPFSHRMNSVIFLHNIYVYVFILRLAETHTQREREKSLPHQTIDFPCFSVSMKEKATSSDI